MFQKPVLEQFRWALKDDKSYVYLAVKTGGYLPLYKTREGASREESWFGNGECEQPNSVNIIALIPTDFLLVPPTVDTPDLLEVTLYLKCSTNKKTNVITESVFGVPGMGTEALVRRAYIMNGITDPDVGGVAWWVGQINSGKWKSTLDFLLGFNSAMANAKK